MPEKWKSSKSTSKQIHSITFAIKLPSIIRLLKYVRVKNHNRVKFSRANIYARDDYTCQYCGKKFPSEDLTFDHVVPVALGGQKRWDNIVAACFRCNHRKGGRTPEEAGMNADSPAHRTALVAGFPRDLPIEVSAGELAGLSILEHRAGYINTGEMN